MPREPMWLCSWPMRTIAIALALTCCATATVHADVAGIAIPRRSKQLADNHYVSRRTFRKTVVFFRKQLSKRGYQHREIPIYGYRGVVIARFVAEGTSKWNAVHVFRLRGKTYIYVVPGEPDKGVDRSKTSE